MHVSTMSLDSVEKVSVSQQSRSRRMLFKTATFFLPVIPCMVLLLLIVNSITSFTFLFDPTKPVVVIIMNIVGIYFIFRARFNMKLNSPVSLIGLALEIFWFLVLIHVISTWINMLINSL